MKSNTVAHFSPWCTIDLTFGPKLPGPVLAWAWHAGRNTSGRVQARDEWHPRIRPNTPPRFRHTLPSLGHNLRKTGPEPGGTKEMSLTWSGCHLRPVPVRYEWRPRIRLNIFFVSNMYKIKAVKIISFGDKKYVHIQKRICRKHSVKRVKLH